MNSLDIVRSEGRRKVIFKLNSAFLTVFTVIGADVFTARSFHYVKSGFAVLEADFGPVKNDAAFRYKGFFALF